MINRYSLIKRLFVVLILFVCINGFGQNSFDDQSRAQFIFDVSKYVSWESGFDEFTIGLLENDADSHLKDAMENLAIEKKMLHERPVKIKSFTSLKEITPTQVLFVNKLSEFNLDSVYARISDKQTLLTTENYEFHKSMINFIVVGGRKRYELNIEKLSSAGLSVSDLFVGLAVKTKEDWQELYRKTDVLLQHEKEVVLQQSLVIDNQKEEIEIQIQQIGRQRSEIKKQQEEINTQKERLAKLYTNVEEAQKELEIKTAAIKKQQIDLDTKEKEILQKNQVLNEKNTEIQEKEKLITTQDQTLNKQLKEIEKQQLMLYFFFVLLLLVSTLGYFIYRSYKIKKRSNKLLTEKNREITAQNAEINQQKEEIEAQRDEIEGQRDLLAEQHRIVSEQKEEIMDSIHYASRIQRAILPPPVFIEAVLPENNFIFSRPRDIVSGDFYWIGKCSKDKVVILAADCTGHGVPGAFMSMLGVSFLNEIVNKREVSMAHLILNELREAVMRGLHQTGKEGEAKDGMDMALCVLDTVNKKLQFSGANNPLYIVHNSNTELVIIKDGLAVDYAELNHMTDEAGNDYELSEIKGDKMPIGIFTEEHKSFSNIEIDVDTGDTFYVFTDGYADQFGGPKGKKFKYKPFKRMLLDFQNDPMVKQKEIIESTITDWQGKQEQVDDILVIGIRV